MLGWWRCALLLQRSEQLRAGVLVDINAEPRRYKQATKLVSCPNAGSETP